MRAGWKTRQSTFDLSQLFYIKREEQVDYIIEGFEVISIHELYLHNKHMNRSLIVYSIQQLL